MTPDLNLYLKRPLKSTSSWNDPCPHPLPELSPDIKLYLECSFPEVGEHVEEHEGEHAEQVHPLQCDRPPQSLSEKSSASGKKMR